MLQRTSFTYTGIRRNSANDTIYNKKLQSQYYHESEKIIIVSPEFQKSKNKRKLFLWNAFMKWKKKARARRTLI